MSCGSWKYRKPINNQLFRKIDPNNRDYGNSVSQGCSGSTECHRKWFFFSCSTRHDRIAP